MASLLDQRLHWRLVSQALGSVHGDSDAEGEELPAVTPLPAPASHTQSAAGSPELPRASSRGDSFDAPEDLAMIAKIQRKFEFQVRILSQVK